MFKTLDEMKKARSTNVDSLMKEVEKISGNKKYEKDSRFWEASVDKVGNGHAIIRFLPAPINEDVAFVRLWSHGFKGPTGKWYIENSLTTLNLPDPVGDINMQLWNSGNEENKKIASSRKRKLAFISNILVIKDPINPENDGKVFLFKYGKKIFDKITHLANPEFEDEDKTSAFDFWEGANFRLRMHNEEGADGKSYRSYDKSSFDKPSKISESDVEIEKIWKSQYSLKELVSEKNFKSYEELQKRLNLVLGTTSFSGSYIDEGTVKDSDQVSEFGDEAYESQTRPPKKQSSSVTATKKETNFEAEDDTLSYFSKLAQDTDDDIPY